MEMIRALVSDELNLIENKLYNLDDHNEAMYKDLSDFIGGKSKRIRSAICLLYLKAHNCVISDNIIDLLLAVELIHNASLLHDDVMDDSHLRRGVPNLFDKYGSKLSVVSGDYILSVAVENLLKLGDNKIFKWFLDAVKKMSEAEIKQFFSRNSDISIEQYLNISQGKTASLFVACIKSAALLSGLDTDIASDFAYNFGILFQINNDMEADSANNDLKNGVKTSVSISGIEKTLALKDNYKEELSKILKKFPDNRYKYGIKDLIELL